MKNDCERAKSFQYNTMLLLWSIKIIFYANKCFSHLVSHLVNNKINQILFEWIEIRRKLNKS